MFPRFCKRRVPFPAFGGWVIIPRRNLAERKLLALAASVRVILDKLACQELRSALTIIAYDHKNIAFLWSL